MTRIVSPDGLATLCAALVESAKREATGRGRATQQEQATARAWLTEEGGMFDEICKSYGYDRREALRAIVAQLREASK